MSSDPSTNAAQQTHPPTDPTTSSSTSQHPHATPADELTPAEADNFVYWNEAANEASRQLLAAVRERHISAGFSEATAPTQVPESFESPLWEAIKLAHTNPEEANRRVRALVGQPLFIEDDEWSALCEWGCAAGLRILCEYGFKPSIKANGSALAEAGRRNNSPTDALEILRPLIEVTNSFGPEFARATAEQSGESACRIARQLCENKGLPSDHELIRVITTWCKQQTGQDW